jgi:(S)-ureidoglycine aminohydrolase
MSSRNYHVPAGGHPAQTELLTGRAVFTDAYAVIPKGVIRDIVARSPASPKHFRIISST